MAVCFNVAKWYALSSVLVALAVGSSLLQLTGEPDPIAEGDELSLSCSRTTDNSPPLFAVIWYRNTKAMFQTVQGIGLTNTSNCSEYNEISGRITVDADKQKHKVTLQINSSLDDGSVWKCNTDAYYSNNLTVEVLITTTVATTSTVKRHSATTVTDHGFTSSEKSPTGGSKVYVIAGSSVGLVIVIVIVIAVIAVACRKYIAAGRFKDTKQTKGVHETEESEIEMVDNACYVGLGDEDEDITTGEATVQGNVSGADLQNMNVLHSEAGSSGLHLEKTRLDLTNEYTSVDMVIETKGSHVNNEDTIIDNVTAASGSDVNNGKTISDVMTEITKSEETSIYTSIYVDTETPVSADPNGYTSIYVDNETPSAAQYNEYSSTDLALDDTKSDMSSADTTEAVFPATADVKNMNTSITEVTENAGSEMNYEYSNEDMITETAGSVVSHKYTNEDMTTETAGSEVNYE